MVTAVFRITPRYLISKLSNLVHVAENQAVSQITPFTVCCIQHQPVHNAQYSSTSCLLFLALCLFFLLLSCLSRLLAAANNFPAEMSPDGCYIHFFYISQLGRTSNCSTHQSSYLQTGSFFTFTLKLKACLWNFLIYPWLHQDKVSNYISSIDWCDMLTAKVNRVVKLASIMLTAKVKKAVMFWKNMTALQYNIQYTIYQYNIQYNTQYTIQYTIY